ncbi:hypothetical protein C100_04375 [Sphingobium sp. C100]|uniref:DNA -binding domain-containing protein n=1 Tax=Sphingobium sp. C100 TaxID=1207055 RepID=UPI0003D5FD04|nr:DUF2285 domain-containing protein [Sphingobium sp. C100]ETI64976.1 hypothetical protein C100_04375 [Sphingobium sp. C100]
MTDSDSDDSKGAVPGVSDLAPREAAITPYDRLHHTAYLRLLDAEAAGMAWRDAAITILALDCDADSDKAHATWQSHLDRARWMSSTGFRLLLEAAQQKRGTGKT